MRAAVLLPFAIGLAAAGPVHKRQTMDFAAISDELADDIAAIDPADLGPVDPVVQATTVADATSAYDATSAIAAATSAVTAVVEKRSACATYSGAGPVVTSSPSAWVSDPALTTLALQAATPTNYVAASNFQNLQGAAQQMGYLTVHTLDEYSPAACAAYCDSEDLCQGFNVYLERDPSAEPSCTDGGDPDSITTIACTLYSFHVAASKATNTGQWRDNFHVVITGSNGYNKADTKLSSPTMTTIDGFKAPQDFGDAAVNAPKYNDFDSYITYKTYTDAYDPRICAKACTTQTKYNKDTAVNGEYKACNYFVAYVLAKNDEPQGLFCSLYSLPWSRTYAVNTGYYDGSDHYTIYNSLAYTVDSDLDFGNNAAIEDFVYTDA
ncbi:hypothetical protein GTA08_BOTSDO05634 [Neofusicoccum parvum]|uniref:Uncharacterized protein n=1 Tax=Neofusicoccum parvum TaxID=310453 RepID=A0ACB5RSU6_9PEZI|nr:hypothetical protein GTA08_BOTSDO05634 [Neofusicoccum parvum]